MSVQHFGEDMASQNPAAEPLETPVEVAKAPEPTPVGNDDSASGVAKRSPHFGGRPVGIKK